MSIFKDSGIILKIQKQEKNFLYTIFSQKFGKIIVQKKIKQKEKNIDLGFLINYEIKTNGKQNISNIKNIKIINEFNTENKNFSIINNYLELLKLILKKSAFGIENENIVDILSKINKYKKDDIEIKIILAKLKILNVFGELNIENNNKIIFKILKFININNFGKIIKLSGFSNELKEKLNFTFNKNK